MTGRARLAGQTRRQIAWHILYHAPLTVRNAHLSLREHGIELTATATDKLLRAMFDQGYLTRYQAKLGGQGAKGCTVYVYATIGSPPPDGRAVTAIRVLSEFRERRKDPHYLRPLPVDDPADDGDNWGGEGCARKKGTPDDLPGIPSLADLLAR